ncbi:Dcp1p-Dcp2p decapping enzyme complex alpha subunit [Ascosphaera acerosa]|nr:Dcp1p-Dcp2p decapping enzyme complex alpha subunit [Ascosphaera acerosa]
MRLEFPNVCPSADGGDAGDGEDSGDATPYTDYDAIPSAHLFIFTGNQGPHNQPTYQYFSEMYITPSDWDAMRSLNAPLDDSIVEAYQDDHKRWRFMRLRDDKHECNHVSTVESVIESIEDRVDEDDLIKAAVGIRNAWKKRAAARESGGGSASVSAGVDGGARGLKRRLPE